MRRLSAFALLWLGHAVALAADVDTATVVVHRPAAAPLTLTVEVAATEAARRRGVSDRVPFDGMLFVFPVARKVCMWMKETSVPLAAFFISADGVVHHTAAMQPHTTTPHCADDTRYVLERALSAEALRRGDRVELR